MRRGHLTDSGSLLTGILQALCYNLAMSDQYDYGYDTKSQQNAWYYLTFPLDAWIHSKDPVFIEQKRSELWPIMVFLLPLIVLVAGFTLELNLFSGLFFYGLEGFLLALVSMAYLKIRDIGRTLEIFFNYWLAFLLMTLVMLVIVTIFGIFF